ncbi:MAG: AMP-binding protein [Candidatus Sedimenticola sp. (ex Thyasira tokunagai)]
MKKSYFHRGGETPLLGATIPEHFAEVVSRYPDREAVVSLPQQRRLTYRQLAEAVDQVAHGLMGMGFVKGERIGIWSTNNIEWLLLQMATARIGVVLVNINPAYRPKELAYALQRSQVQGLFVIPAFRHSDYIAMLQALLPELSLPLKRTFDSADFPQLRSVVVYDPEAPELTTSPAPGFITWQEMLQAGEGIDGNLLQQISDSLDMDEPINIQYTSGTTGFPKAVLLTHHNILNNAWFAAHEMHFTEKDRLCVPVPFYHCFGMVLSNLLCMTVGACLVIPCEHFDPQAVLQAVAKERCSALHGVPTMFIALLEHPGFSGFDLTSLRTGIMAGAPCPAVLMKQVIEELHCREILIGYGQTEASPLTHLTTREDSMVRRTESVGRNMPHQEVKVIDVESGATQPIGEAGEICFRGHHIMCGYYGDRSATEKAIDSNRWLHSGDLGVMDEEGYLQITGRLKDMIIRGGENIYPREIEELLFTHPKIAEVAVFGVPDDYYGEEIMAWVQLHQGQSATEQEIHDFCMESLAHFKIPRYIHFVDEFPMTVTGKLQKYRMREMSIEGGLVG